MNTLIAIAAAFLAAFVPMVFIYITRKKNKEGDKYDTN